MGQENMCGNTTAFTLTWMSQTLRDVACYFYADEDSSPGTLVQDLSDVKRSYENNLPELERARNSICTIMERIGQMESRIQDRALQLLDHDGPSAIAQQSASHALVATQIEMALLKLAVLRAKAWKYVYFSSSSEKIADSHAQLLASHTQLRRDLDDANSALASYQDVMTLVGGDYAQIVEDYARVQRESEECKGDLRRLGWTGLGQ